VSADLGTLLRDTTPGVVDDLDVDRLLRRGVRRRWTKRVGAAAALLAVVGTGSLIVLGPDTIDRLPVIGEAPQPAVGEWHPLPAAPMSPREVATIATDGPSIAIFGGETGEMAEVDGTMYSPVRAWDGAVYDALTDRWTAVPSPPLPPRDGANVELAGDQLVVVGGRGLTTVPGGGVSVDGGTLTLETARFDLARRKWEPIGAPDIAPRTPEVVTWDGDRLVIWGGDPQERPPLVDGATWTEEGGWTTIEAAPLAPRLGAAVAVVDDHLFVWGGYQPLDDTGDDVELFADGALLDLGTMTWEAVPNAPLAARWIGHDGWPHRENVRVDGDRVLIVGGTRRGAELFRDGAWFDLGDRTWTPITPAPSDARFATARRGGVLAVDDDVSEADPYVTLWRYDEALDRWDRTSTRLRTSLEIHDLAPARIVVSAHGDDGRWQDSPRIGVWEADSDRLVHTRPPLSPRWRTAIAPLPDGLLVWGGLNAEPVGDEGVDSRPAGDGARLVRWS
jgi:hypothetical protein